MNKPLTKPNKNFLTTLALTASVCGLMGFSATAAADHGDAYAESFSDYAKVVSSEPVVRRVRIGEPRQECWDERVSYREPVYHHGLSAGAILGGIIGGVAGHQIGGGHGRDAATAAGAVIGANIGGAHDRYRGEVEHVGYEQRCRTVSDARYEEQIEGYDVTYRYQGQTYQTRLPYDPGRRLAVQVDVRPVRD